MDNLTIRKVENGFVIVIDKYWVHEYENARREYVAATDRDMIDLVTEHFFGGVLDIVKVDDLHQGSGVDSAKEANGAADADPS